MTLTADHEAWWFAHAPSSVIAGGVAMTADHEAWWLSHAPDEVTFQPETMNADRDRYWVDHAPASAISPFWTVTNGANGLAATARTLTATNGLTWNVLASCNKRLMSGPGFIEGTIPLDGATRGHMTFGLSKTDPVLLGIGAYYQINYGAYLIGGASGSNVQITNFGTPVATPTTWAPGDIYRVGVEGGVVKYRKNGTLIHTDAQAVTYPLWGACAFYSGSSGTSGRTQLADALISGNWA
jgi:hypothetical protein